MLRFLALASLLIAFPSAAVTFVPREPLSLQLEVILPNVSIIGGGQELSGGDAFTVPVNSLTLEAEITPQGLEKPPALQLLTSDPQPSTRIGLTSGYELVIDFAALDIRLRSENQSCHGGTPLGQEALFCGSSTFQSPGSFSIDSATVTRLGDVEPGFRVTPQADGTLLLGWLGFSVTADNGTFFTGTDGVTRYIGISWSGAVDIPEGGIVLQPVPEPGSALLLGEGFAFLALRRRCQRRMKKSVRGGMWTRR